MSPLASSSRSGRVRLVVAAAALLLLGACTGRPPTPTSYGETTKTNFMEGCLESAQQEGISDVDANEYCDCSYKAIVSDIPFEDFKEINSELSEDPAALSGEMLDIRNRCANSLE